MFSYTENLPVLDSKLKSSKVSVCTFDPRGRTHVVAMEMSDEDLGELSWPEAAPHQLYLAPLATVKHPAPQVCHVCMRLCM